MSTQVSNSMSFKYKMAESVHNHAGKAMFGSFASAMAPGTAFTAALAVAAVTRGKVMRPMQWLQKPHVANVMNNWVKASLVTFAGTCAVSFPAHYAVKKAHSEHWGDKYTDYSSKKG